MAVMTLVGVNKRAHTWTVTQQGEKVAPSKKVSWIMARFLAQLIMVGVQTVGRAFGQTLRQEYQVTMAARRAAEEAGRDGTRAARAASSTGISLQEAQQILNIKNIDDIEAIRKVSCVSTLVYPLFICRRPCSIMNTCSK
ncbi:Mitochondrial import inner membrane translocase subunit tim16-B [Geodia barretti]|uniref:Mitochondrial import inner membrane translocase subunit tim16-B n=1 Tax=Geodia barretti TaxID=519541 RepID=A0AA35RCH8_GEOBA|nr:Mitochondrial import inner membrane translocase subunit tim16-B [Geodia barretti]